MSQDTKLAEKLAAKSEREGECLRWTGGHTKAGYGSVRVGRTHRGVHVVAYELNHGPVPAGLEVDHTCRVRDCVKPDHLEAVTHAENLRRSSNPYRPGRTHCSRGHEYIEGNTIITKKGTRLCRTCVRRSHLDSSRRYKARKRAERSLIA